MNLNKISLIAAVAALMLTSCNNDLVLQSETSDNAIEFRTVMDKTRASLVDSKDEITSFFVHAGLSNNDLSFMNVAAYRLGDDVWTYAPKKYWPTDNSGVNFYAYAPIKDVNMQSDLSISNGKVSFGYAVPYDQSKSNRAVDLLVALKENRTKDQGTVPFEFNHALSSVIFSAKNDNPEESELVYTISRIAIRNLYNQATYTYNEGWDSYDNLCNEDVNGDGNIDSYDNIYVAGIPESGVAVNPGGSYVRLLSLNDYMMVLPQVSKGTHPSINFGDDSFVEVTFSLKDGEGDDIFVDKKVLFRLYEFEFEKGYRYNFQFSITGSGYDENGENVDPNPTVIVLEVEALEEWGEGNDYDGENPINGTLLPVNAND